MKDYSIYTEQMTVGYDGKPLIKDIEIRLKKGEILTLIGPNGAGKSTILKSIIRQLRLVAGTVYLDGEMMHKMSGKEVARKLAVVMTERIRPEMMTCEDIVATGRYPYTGALGILSSEDHKKVWEAMETVHALEFKDRDFTAISDGQRQRVLLARAICQEPEIIVLDEPTSFLDIRHKLELLAILKRMVKERQTAVFMSLHELDLAQKVSDCVICVKGDHIQKYGAPEEIFSSGYIHELYEIESGSYNAAFGCVEMEKPSGEPKVFVIGGNGKGIPVYRKLQRKGIPFAAGVLHKNDLDYQVAKVLAAEIIAEEPFEPIREEQVKKAAEILKQCEKVICCQETFGTMNQGNRELLVLAESLGKIAEKP
ncbi:MAG: ATP-binding cassette domain-containing protein [Eubacteriales bacterium]|nr:ATP-binding cassette domain-containing protein [Eubacteriales bacterium]